jgi:hypothetical protein
MKMEKLRPVETIPGTGAERIKENGGGGEFNMILVKSHKQRSSF